MNADKHTPGTLEVSYGAVQTTGGIAIAKMDRNEPRTTPTERDANAAHMVLTWNAHDELVAALRGLLWLANDHDWEESKLPELEKARAVLAKLNADKSMIEPPKEYVALRALVVQINLLMPILRKELQAKAPATWATACEAVGEDPHLDELPQVEPLPPMTAAEHNAFPKGRW